MFNKHLLVHIILCFAIVHTYGQDCNVTVKGHVYDEASETPLSYVNVFIPENSQGTITDDNGDFFFDSLCLRECHLIFSHIGCEAVKIHIEFAKDTVLRIGLSHTPTSLGTVVVEGKKDDNVNQPTLSVNRQFIEDNANQNLSSLLENETGVHLLKNGSGISKPVVHGLYGNRLTILNNGIVQSGQQWGNDHSPEIDPFAADKITVLKGANAIEYGGSNLGSVVLVEPERIEREPHLHGQAKYIFDSNGRGHSVNARLGKYNPALAWRINGTFKRSGDKRTSDYFLNNTGIKETNFSAQLEKSWNEKLFVDFYASTFNTQLGILRGSHIGNLTDLEQALDREIPFFTEDTFSYAIDAPKQHVSHHLIKTKAKYFFNDHKVLEFVLAGQINDREEFDVRRSGRTDVPALSLSQKTIDTELKYKNEINHDWNLKLGIQNTFTDNTNDPETGILPLIPDYISWKNALFTTISRQSRKAQLNVGLRYDYTYQNVATISNSIPREIIRYTNNFHNLSGLFSIQYKLTKTQSLSLNSGYAMRNPAINELYSNGLHQGVSGIEEGDVTLNTEKSIKNTLEYKWVPNAKFSFNALAYHQHFRDFIFLNPQEEFRLTIRGAFPVFRYEQTNANIHGLDISTQFTLGNSFISNIKYSYLKGQNIEEDSPLIFMPPNSAFANLIYRFKNPIEFSKNVILQDTEIEINNRTVFQQNNYLENQDFVAPPPTYALVGMKMSTNLISAHYKIRWFVKVDNLFNVKYRDYLNRQRYFADDTGRNITVGMNYKF